jgi:hypothetical protein
MQIIPAALLFTAEFHVVTRGLYRAKAGLRSFKQLRLGQYKFICWAKDTLDHGNRCGLETGAPATDSRKNPLQAPYTTEPLNSHNRAKEIRQNFGSEINPIAKMKTYIPPYYHSHTRFARHNFCPVPTVLPTQDRNAQHFQSLSHSAVHTNTDVKTLAFSPSATGHTTTCL